MIERLEVTPGPGTVIRFGPVAAWVSASASPALITFLAASARNLISSSVGGEQLVEHLSRVLAERDPEPQVAFAVVGPSRHGWVALLHGAVQLWDGTRWLTVESEPGWVQSAAWPRPTLAVMPAGTPPPPASPDSAWGLEAGVVPGGGFTLLPTTVQPGNPVGASTASTAPLGSDPAAPPGSLDLRSAEVLARVVPYPPLPPCRDRVPAAPGAPVVAGVACSRGHFNRGGMAICARCGEALDEHRAYSLSATRPALGCLVVDDGTVYRLDSGYLVGSDPADDATVRGGLARPLVLAGHEVAPCHAEVRLHDWDVVVTDRSSQGGTYVYAPGSTAWERLRPHGPRILEPGTHVAFGQRVVSFLSPWTTVAGEPESPDEQGSDQETRARNLGQ